MPEKLVSASPQIAIYVGVVVFPVKEKMFSVIRSVTVDASARELHTASSEPSGTPSELITFGSNLRRIQVEGHEPRTRL